MRRCELELELIFPEYRQPPFFAPMVPDNRVSRHPYTAFGPLVPPIKALMWLPDFRRSGEPWRVVDQP